VEVKLLVSSIPDVPPISSTENALDFLFQYSNADLQPQEAFLTVSCSFVYNPSSDMWSNVTAMWRRNDGSVISYNQSDHLHQVLGQLQANLSISVSTLKNYEGLYECIAASKFYSHSVLLKQAQVVFSPPKTPNGEAACLLKYY
jgi:hypothetical protein